MIEQAILKINPTAEFSVHGGNINTIEWLNGTTPIDRQDILDKQAELQADYDIKQYQRDRKKEYPEIGDQLDMLWHSIDEDASLKSKYFKFHQAILAVKSKYSK